MKNMKKLVALLLAAIMCLGLVTVASATDQTGSITINNATVGQKYTVYKIFDATYNADTKAVSYTVSDGAVKTLIESSGLFTVATTANSEGGYLVTEKTGVTGKQIGEWIQGQIAASTDENPVPFAKLAEKTADGNTVNFTGVEAGYLYITSGLGATVTITSNTPEAIVQDKNVKDPNIPSDGGKKVTTANYNGTATIGQELDFEIKFEATNYKTTTSTNDKGELVASSVMIEEYKVVDTPTALKIDQTSVQVRVGDATITGAVEIADNGVMTVTLPWVNDNAGVKTSKYSAPVTVVITYKATVTEAAANTNAKNTAVISYDGTEIGSPETETESYKITVDKYAEGNESSKLAGAKFELYTAMTGGEKIALVADAEGGYRVATADEQKVEGFKSVEVVTDDNGAAVIKGLGKGTYYLQETVAPDGYNLKTDRTAVELGKEGTDGNGVAKISNQSGSTLPATGGIGTTIFYIVGAVLVVGAGVLLITKKRMAHNA